jgi:nucleoside-diphosphate-sugar epimerase
MPEAAPDRWVQLPPRIDVEEARRWLAGIPRPMAVTGGTGFIGSHLLDVLLEGGVRPRLLVREVARLPERAREEAEVVKGDMDDLKTLTGLVSGCGAVVHAAGLVRSGSRSAFDRANRAGTENLVLALARGAPGARLVHISSLAAAGPSEDPRGIGPEAPPRPVSAYGRSKLAAEAAVRKHPGRWVILRPPSTFGPRDTDVLQFFRLAARRLVPIPSGERFLTVAYVADVVRAILAALSGAGDRQALHIGDPFPRTLRDLLAILAESGGVRAHTVPVPSGLVRVAGFGGDVLQWLGIRGVPMTSDKARELVARHWTARTEDSLRSLGLGGSVSPGDGFAVTWAWYRENGWVPHAKIHARHWQDSERR